MLVSGRAQMSWMKWQCKEGYLSSADTHWSLVWLRPRLDPGKAVRGRWSPQARESDRYKPGNFHPAARGRMHFWSLQQTLWRPRSAIWITSNKASILPWAWALMGNYRLSRQMSMETCLRHLLFLVIASARGSCFHSEGLECPIHSTEKALRSIQLPGQPLLCQGSADKGRHSLHPLTPRVNMAPGLGPPTSKHKDGTQWLVMALPLGAPGPSEESRN